MIDYIDAHRDQFGVEPICRVLAEQVNGLWAPWDSNPQPAD